MKILAKNKKHLKEFIKKEIAINGNKCDLNHIHTSLIIDMAYLFTHSSFNGDISQWNTSNVLNMASMFESSKFNADISKWNVSRVKDMNLMFDKSVFNGDISNWDVSKVLYCFTQQIC